jgi:hypothetical protein
VIAAPPFDAGAVHDSATCPCPAVPATAVGAPGTVAGVTAAEAAEFGPIPTLLTAATWKVYAVPLVRPVTVNVVPAEPVEIGVCAVVPMYGVTW